MKSGIIKKLHISHLKAILYHFLSGKKMSCLASKMLSPKKMNAIQIAAASVERIFIPATLQYFGFEYMKFKTCSKSLVTKYSMILLLCHLQNCVLFTLC